MSSTGAIVDATSHQPSVSDTADAVLALVAAGQGSSKVKTATPWLEHHFESYVSTDGVDNPGRLALLALAAVAAGANPREFGGRSSKNNLVARLRATERSQGASAGVFGPVSSTNTFKQSLALLALMAVKISGKAIHLGESFLARSQCTNGGWEYSRASNNTPCAKPDAASYAGPDTNSTALAVMAIVTTGGRFPHNPETFFYDSEEANGSFGYIGVSGDGQQGDPDSTAYVVQALVALGQLSKPRFVRGGVSPIEALDRFQYGCSAPSGQRGEFAYDNEPSQLATLQAVPAAAKVALPIKARKLAAAESRLACSAG
jgi:hypothetical protein